MLFVSIKQSKKKIKSNIMDNFIDNPKAPFYEQIKFAQLTCDQFKLQDKRIKELEKKTENIIKENEFWQNEVTSHADGLEKLEDIIFENEEDDGLSKIDKNIELLISHKELMNKQNKRIDELEKKLSQSMLTSSIMFASVIIGIVGSWRLLSK